MTRWLAGVVAIGISVTLSSACAGNSTHSTNTSTTTSAVALSPASGPKASTPTWSTTAACPSGFQGSAVFSAVDAHGQIFSISRAVNGVNAPFAGTLLADIAFIQSQTYVPNGGTVELVVICYSGQGETGNQHPEMNEFITFSANGSTYSTSSSGTPTTGGGGASPTPSGTGSGSSGGTGSGSSSQGAAGSGSSGSPNPTSSGAPSPSPVDSNFDVTG